MKSVEGPYHLLPELRQTITPTTVLQFMFGGKLMTISVSVCKLKWRNREDLTTVDGTRNVEGYVMAAGPPREVL